MFDIFHAPPPAALQDSPALPDADETFAPSHLDVVAAARTFSHDSPCRLTPHDSEAV